MIFNVEILLRINNRLTRSYKQFRRNWSKTSLRDMKRNCCIIILEAEIFWLLSKLHDSLKCSETEYSRDQLFSLYQMITSDAVDWCCHDMQCHWDAYIVSGSNFLWSVDDYLKLKSYDIEIYTDIDAHSCYIIWIYVRITACSEVSVLRQFLNVVDEIKLQSWIIWSDQDSETSLLTETHHKFIRAYDSDISLENCYFYDTSVKNQRMKIWWRQLMKKQLFKW